MPVCAVCEIDRADVRPGPGDISRIDCPRCGIFTITHEATVNLRREEQRLRISCWLRHASIFGQLPDPFKASHIDFVKQTWRERTVGEKQDALLLALAKMSQYPGDDVTIVDEVDHVLAWCEHLEEFEFHLASARDRGLISAPTMDPSWIVTPTGWDRVSDLTRSDPASTDLVFVAMAFHESLSAAWTDGLRPGIKAAGYRPERVDSTPDAGKIDDRIMALVRQSRFVVVDVTRQNCGAYFEAGFALGLGRAVIWSVHEDDLKNLHFDTRQFNHIVWRDPADLRRKVTDRLVGVFGRGPAPMTEAV